MNKKKDLDKYIECIDHTVSGEKFSLYHDKKYDMLVTQPKPEAQELQKYYESNDYISHTDSKRSIIEIAYFLVKKYTLRKKTQLITKLYNGTGVLLDVGAGTGDFVSTAQKKGWDVFGQEPSEKARLLAMSKNVTLSEDLKSVEKTKFNMITMWHVLEHVPNLNEQLDKLTSLLDDEGIMLIAVPNFKSYDAQYYNTFWAAFDVPRHLWHFSKVSIEKLCKEHKMKLVKVLPMKYDAYYVSLLSEKYKTNTFNYLRAFRTAWLSNRKAKRNGEYSSLIYVIKKQKT